MNTPIYIAVNEFGNHRDGEYTKNIVYCGIDYTLALDTIEKTFNPANDNAFSSIEIWVNGAKISDKTIKE